MIWAQGAVALVVWCIYGYMMSRRTARLFARHTRTPRGFTIAYGIIVMLAGLGALIAGGIAVVSLGGMRDGLLTPWGWLATIGVGIVFVHLQTLGAVSMLYAAAGRETQQPPETSESEEKHP